MPSPLVPLPPNYPPNVPTVPTGPVQRKQPTVKKTANPVRVHLDEHPRLRTVAYNLTAAAAGWSIGLGPWALDGITHYGTHDTARGVWVGIGLALFSLLAEWKTHTWRSTDRAVLVRTAGWAGRIPLATTLLALALYGPDATL